MTAGGDSYASYVRPDDLPEYRLPPVSEVSIGIQFNQLPLRSVDIGALWDRFKTDYPHAEDRPPLATVRESFGAAPAFGLQFEIMNAPPMPMAVFMAEDRASLVQVQPTRFQCAWRKATPGGAYPSYATFRGEFVRNADVFLSFVEDAGWPAPSVIQAEVIYLNDLPLMDGYRIDDPAGLFSFWRDSEPPSGDPIEDVRFATRYLVSASDGVPFARLQLGAEPVITERGLALRVALTFRGEPFAKADVSNTESLAAVMRFVDEGHHRIVRKFTESTTESMHRRWGRTK